MSDKSDTGLRERLAVESELLDLVRNDGSEDLVLHAQCIRGRWSIEGLKWLGDRRQRIGRGDSFAAAWRAAFPVEDGGAE